jgi:hypothetical protein
MSHFRDCKHCGKPVDWWDGFQYRCKPCRNRSNKMAQRKHRAGPNFNREGATASNTAHFRRLRAGRPSKLKDAMEQDPQLPLKFKP